MLLSSDLERGITLASLSSSGNLPVAIEQFIIQAKRRAGRGIDIFSINGQMSSCLQLWDTFISTASFIISFDVVGRILNDWIAGFSR